MMAGAGRAAGGVNSEIEAKFDTTSLGWPVTGNFTQALGKMYDEVAAARQ